MLIALNVLVSTFEVHAFFNQKIQNEFYTIDELRIIADKLRSTILVTNIEPEWMAKLRTTLPRAAKILAKIQKAYLVAPRRSQRGPDFIAFFWLCNQIKIFLSSREVASSPREDYAKGVVTTYQYKIYLIYICYSCKRSKIYFIEENMKDITKCEVDTIFGGLHCFNSCNTGKKAKRLRCK